MFSLQDNYPIKPIKDFNSIENRPYIPMNIKRDAATFLALDTFFGKRRYIASAMKKQKIRVPC